MLVVSNVDSYYGLSHILHGVSLVVGDGETVALLGRNGAGKSTTLKTIMGVVRPQGGSIEYGGTPIAGLRSSEILRKGIGYVPEERGIFPNLTVMENLKMGHIVSKRRGDWTFGEYMQYIGALFPRLMDRLKQLGKKLSGGEQQMLAIARALGSRPGLLLVDEPTEGLAPEYVDRIREILVEMKKGKVAILLVEHNIQMALSVSERVYFLEKGQIRYEGRAGEVAADPEIRLRYLGV